MGPETLTETERCHYPVSVEVVKARIVVEGDRAKAHLLEEEDVHRLHEIERRCIVLRGASFVVMEALNEVRLTASDTVLCVRDLTFERRSLQSLHGMEGRLQLIARPIHAWSYKNEETTWCGLDWELDRVYENYQGKGATLKDVI